MEIEILKFGGMATKTKSTREKIAEIIKKSSIKKHLIVVSAMGRAGFPYATDTLKELIEDKNVTAKEVDRLLSIGEVISSIVLSCEMNQKGIKAYSLSLKELGFVADMNYGRAYVKEMNSNKIIDLFLEYDVLLCPGFVAVNEEGEPTTFSRGGSDLTAILLCELFDIKKVDLYKDVDGVYPCKPPLDQRIKPYAKISYDEQLVMNDCNLEIVQKEAVEEAKKMNIAINIKSFNTLKMGTIISQESMGAKVICVNSKQSELIIGTFFPCEIKEQIIKILKNNHIYVKEERVLENYISFKIASSQMFLARRLILNNFFYSN